MATKNISIDIKDCAGYPSLLAGTHSLKIKTKYLTKVSPISSPISVYIDALPRNYLTFESSNLFYLDTGGKTWDGTLFYSTDRTHWNEYSGTSVIRAEISSGTYKIYICGVQNTKLGFNASKHFRLSGSSSNRVNVSGNIESLLDYPTVDNGSYIQNIQNSAFEYCFHSCNALYDASGLVLPRTTLVNSIYKCLFYGCNFLVSAPSLPATVLADYCYYYMFAGCTYLTTIPQLPATTMASLCYYRMFYNCTSLTIAPNLPATTLANGCYRDMFIGCTSLVNAPALPATTLAISCYQKMFAYCSNLSVAPSLPATALATDCYNNMFYETNVLPDCSNIDFTSASVVASGGLRGLFGGTKLTDTQMLNILPTQNGNCILPVLNLSSGCYFEMFNHCSNITKIPILPATVLASSCYQEMFEGCSSIALTSATSSLTDGTTFRIPTTGTGTVGTNSLLNMFKNTGGSFRGTPTINTTYYYEIRPINVIEFRAVENFTIDLSTIETDGSISYSLDDGVSWELARKRPNLPSITTTNNNIKLVGYGNTYFRKMSDASNGVSLSTTSNDILVSCYGDMDSLLDYRAFDNGESITRGTTTFAGAFKNATKLRTMPDLSATTLQQGAYTQMFMGCTNLIYAKPLPALTIPLVAYSEMFSACSNIKLSTTKTGDYIGKYRIPVSGTGSAGFNALLNMFIHTGGSFKGTPSVNTTYYQVARWVLTLRSAEKVYLYDDIIDGESSLCYDISSGNFNIGYYYRNNTMICQSDTGWFSYEEWLGGKCQENDIIHIYKFPVGKDYHDYGYVESNLSAYKLCDIKFVNGEWTILNDYS